MRLYFAPYFVRHTRSATLEQPYFVTFESFFCFAGDPNAKMTGRQTGEKIFDILYRIRMVRIASNPHPYVIWYRP